MWDYGEVLLSWEAAREAFRDDGVLREAFVRGYLNVN